MEVAVAGVGAGVDISAPNSPAAVAECRVEVEAQDIGADRLYERVDAGTVA